ncbi:hypothetical protein CK203_039826 [Vitis vinifera]|uniref:Retrotransposon gag domain-containing protein n=1 Tax=Vitis vinifera TaxID=29760 RepID=A0A438HQG3_VITVI|nr:hypothetical protein CK203_039826 [Vitis vinifera]
MELELKVESRICGYKWSINLVTTFGMVIDETVPHASQTAQALPPRVLLGTPFHLADHYETIPPPTITVPPLIVPTTDDIRLAEQEARVERLESKMRQIRLQDGGLTWDDRDDIPAASLLTKFRMLDIDGAAQRWFASIESSRLRTWENVAHEFLTQFAFSVDIDVCRRELEATKQRPMSLFLPLLVVGGQKCVEKAIARGLWTDTAPSHDNKGKKLVGSSTRSGEINMQPRPSHPRTTTHPPPRPYAQRPMRQFTPLDMTLTRAFEKLRDAGLIVPLAPPPLATSYSSSFLFT